MDKYQNKAPRTSLKDLRRPQLEPPKKKKSLTPFLAGMIAVILLSNLTSMIRDSSASNPPPPPKQEEIQPEQDPSPAVPDFENEEDADHTAS